MLFLTLIAAGISLLLGAGAAKVIGVALLGIAMAWAFGSNSRAVHWLFFAAGLVLLLGPSSREWYTSSKARKAFKNGL